MARTVPISGLADAIVGELRIFTAEVVAGATEAVMKTADEAAAELHVVSPVRTGVYAKNWGVKKSAGANFALAIVYNKKRYQIAHLLENGHAKRGGGRVRAIPHIRPVEEDAKVRLEERIRKAIEAAQ